MTNRRRPEAPANLTDDHLVESLVFRSQVRLGIHATLGIVVLVMVCVPAAWAWWFVWMLAVIGNVAWWEIDWQRYLRRRHGR